MRVPASRRFPRFPIVNSVLCVSLLAALPASTVLAEDPRCAADVDSDGGIGAGDLSAVLAAWGTVATPGSPLDINGDGFVAGADLTAVLVGWTAAIDCSTGGLDWATVIEATPDPEVIYDPEIRERIIATGFPWRVRDNGTNMEMLLIPPGEFDMGCGPNGCPDELPCLSVEERPVHHVILTNPYYIGRYEVTQTEWLTMMTSNPSATQGSTNPVENITWNNAKSFLDASGLRFATEAEWEYACRAGTSTPFHGTKEFPDGLNCFELLGLIAWYGDCCNSQPRPVGLKDGNGFGLHDMSGNVSEYVGDWYTPYFAGTQINPQGGNGSNPNRMRRGTAAAGPAHWHTSSVRFPVGPDVTASFLNYGFRAARNPE